MFQLYDDLAETIRLLQFCYQSFYENIGRKRYTAHSKYQFLMQAAMSLVEFFRYADVSVLTSHDEYGMSIVETVRRESYSAKTYKLRIMKMVQVCY